MPKKRQCIGSMTTNRIGSKYVNRSSSDHLTPFFLTNLSLSALDLHRRQSKAFWRCLVESSIINHSSIFFMPPKLHCLRSEEHTSELQSQSNLVCRLLLEKKNK